MNNCYITPETRKLVLEKMGLKKGDKFKVHHWMNDNQNKYTDIIFECDGENIICPNGIDQNAVIIETQIRYEIEKLP